MKCPFRGSLVALATPFRGGELDRTALEGLVDFHVDNGTDGLVVIGTTGEAPTLSSFERRTVVETVVERAAGRLPVVAGVGTNSTSASVENTRFATEAGVDGVMAVVPYYNRPSPRGLEQHFSAIADATSLPVVLYNVPARTGCDLKPCTVALLRERHANVVAIKEASRSLGRMKELASASDAAVLCGEDPLIAEFLGLGAVGAVNVTGNVAPKQVAELCRVAAPGGDPMRTAELSAWLDPLTQALFIESSPVPTKAALAELGLCTDEVRLPLAALEQENRMLLLAAVREAGLV